MSESNGRGSADDRELPIVDLSAVQADDALLDALGGSDPKVADELGEAELNALLLTWSREVDSEPMPELVDVDTAITTIETAALAKRHRGRGGKRRLLVPVAAAAAVLGIAFGGAGVAARDAQPGDTLWGLTKVLYADKADSVQASYDVRAEFKAAQDALNQGELDEARDALEKAEDRLRNVDAEENREGLEQQHEQLMDELEGDPPVQSEEPPPATEESTSSSSSAPSSPSPTSDPAEEVPPPAESTTPPESSTSPPPPTTTTESSTTSNDASPSGSTSRSTSGTDAGSAGVEGDGVQGDGVQSENEPVG